jgi:hypothetical protein
VGGKARFPARVGARRDAGRIEREHLVRYEPAEDLRLPELQEALGEDSLAFQVTPLEEPKEPEEEGWLQVEQAGEILALAIADQLVAAGFDAFADLPVEAARPAASTIEDAALSIERLLELGRAVSVGGSVDFRIGHERRGDAYATEAVIEAEVWLVGFRPRAGDEPFDELVEVSDSELRIPADMLFTVHVEETETATTATRGEALEADATVAAAVLARAIRRVFADPKLEPALVAFVERSAPSGSPPVPSAEEGGPERGGPKARTPSKPRAPHR